MVDRSRTFLSPLTGIPQDVYLSPVIRNQRSYTTPRSLAIRVLPALIFLLLLAMISRADAQDRYVWSVYSALNNSQGATYDLNGDLWVASTGGVIRYNQAGDSTRIYRTTDGIISLNSTAIGVDPLTGDVYVGSADGGISIHHPDGRWSYATDIAGVPDRPSRRINGFAFRNGLVYVATDFGVGLFQPSDSIFLESYFRFGPFPTNTAVKSIAWSQGRIWLGTDIGLVYAADSGVNLAAPNVWELYGQIPAQPVISMVPFGDSLYLGTIYGGYAVSATGSWRHTEMPGTATHFNVADGLLYSSSGKNLFRYRGGQFETWIDAPDEIVGLGVHRGGLVGVALAEQGYGVVKNDVVTLQIPNAPVANRFTDLALTPDGSIWCASGDRSNNGAGISRLKDGIWWRYTTDNTSQLLTPQVWSVGVGVGGALWAGTYGGGVVEFRPEDGSSYGATRYDSSNSPLRGAPTQANYVLVGKAVADLNGRTWFPNWQEATGTGPTLVVKLAPGEKGRDGSEFESFVHPRFSVHPYKWLVIDDNGTKWLGADQATTNYPGLVFFNDRGTPSNPTDGDTSGAITFAGTGGSLLSDQQSALAIDHDGELWIGTPKGIAVLINPTSVVNFGQQPIFRSIRELRDQYVRAIAVDALNRKWIGTDKGVILLSFDGSEVIRSFTTANSPLVSDEVRTILSVDATGDIYIGTTNGLNKVSTEAVASVSDGVQLQIAPQPFRPSGQDLVRIYGLPQNSVVKIFSASGALVREFLSPGGAVAYWDGRTAAGEAVASGIYIVVAGAPGGDTTAVGKVAVLRE